MAKGKKIIKGFMLLGSLVKFLVIGKKPSGTNREELIKVWTDKNFGPDRVAPYEREIFPAFLQIAKNSGMILEVGVGGGRMIRLLQKCGVRADFYVVDITEKVKYAFGHKVICDARKLPFKDNSFDLVYSLGVVEHFPETAEAIKEHARVVKRGGHVLVLAPRLGIGTIFRVLVYYVGREYEKGSFEIVRGRNLRFSQMRRYFSQANLGVVKEGASGLIVLKRYQGINEFLERMLPRRRFGNTLYCLGKK